MVKDGWACRWPLQTINLTLKKLRLIYFSLNVLFCFGLVSWLTLWYPYWFNLSCNVNILPWNLIHPILCLHEVMKIAITVNRSSSFSFLHLFILLLFDPQNSQLSFILNLVSRPFVWVPQRSGHMLYFFNTLNKFHLFLYMFL